MTMNIAINIGPKLSSVMLHFVLFKANELKLTEVERRPIRYLGNVGSTLREKSKTLFCLAYNN